MSQEKTNKEIVIEAYQRTFGDLDEAAVDEFFSKDFKNHNPTVADGPEGVKALVRMLPSQGVQKQKMEFKHVVAEGDIVIIHSRYVIAETDWRFIDIYRVENGQLAEHWDAAMPTPEERANTNSMF